MRLLTSSASFSAAISASRTLLHVGSVSLVTSIVGLAYEGESQKQNAGVASYSVHEECSFVTYPNLSGIETDVGILSTCSDPDYVCVEDVSSSVGGRCVPDVLVHRNRNLQDVPVTCDQKCTPASACEGLSQEFIDNNIGEGSCCGDKACQGVTGSSYIGAGSCIGNKNCYSMVDATIGDNSCLGDSVEGPEGYTGYACAYMKGVIGSWSCWEYAACYQDEPDQEKYFFYVFNYSCRNISSCHFSSNIEIDEGSCHGDYSCYTAYVNIQSQTCNGDHACSYTEDTIGGGSCFGYYVCYKNSGSIGYSSCYGKKACEKNSGAIGNGICLNDYECQENTSTLSSAPTSAPTSSGTSPPSKSSSTSPPTTQPATSAPTKPTETSSPTAAPTSAPTNAPTKSNDTNSPTAKPTSVPTKTPTTSQTNTPTSGPTVKPTAAPAKAPTKGPTAAPTKSDNTPDPTKKPTVSSKSPTMKPTSKSPTVSPTKKPTKKPSTKTPTARPVSMAPTKSPVKISPTLVLAVDLCYPGCGDFTEIYTDNEFEDIIMKYTPCSPDECTVNIIDESDSCTSCSIDSSRRLRFLQDAEFQSSAITFEIVSDTPLNEQVVINNLDTNITASNDELSQDGVTFRVASNYTQGTIAPTVKPTKKPSKHPSPKSSKSSSKSTKEEKPGKSSKPGPGKPKSGKKSGKATNKKKQDMKKKHEEGAKRKGHFHHIVVGGSV